MVQKTRQSSECFPTSYSNHRVGVYSALVSYCQIVFKGIQITFLSVYVRIPVAPCPCQHLALSVFLFEAMLFGV